MSDPRAAVSLDGIGYEAVTIAHDSAIVYSAAVANGSVSVGLAVSLTDDGEVTLAGDGENIFGKLIKVESDGYCVVQTGGFMTLPGGASATLTVGLKIVGDLGSGSAEGYIQAVSTQDTVSRGIIVDASTTTAVVVRL